MDDDFNTPRAVATIFDFVTLTNRFLDSTKEPDPPLCQYALQTLLQLGGVLTLFQPKKTKAMVDDTALRDKLRAAVTTFEKPPETATSDALLTILLKHRETARQQKDWKTADQIRDTLQHLGFEIQDTEKGPIWRKM